MFRNRLLKILALLMVLNILIIPLTTFSPAQKNKYIVHASEGIVDIRFFNAVISMLGITAAGLAFMSPNFSIPEVDMIQLKDQFAQTLEADAAKKSAWMQAQTDYLAGGVAKTMGAVELAKIGVNDIYNQFKTYINNKIVNPDTQNSINTTNHEYSDFNLTVSVVNPVYLSRIYNTYSYYNGDSSLKRFNTASIETLPSSAEGIIVYYIYDKSGSLVALIDVSTIATKKIQCTVSIYNKLLLTDTMKTYLVNKTRELGIDIIPYLTYLAQDYTGYVSNNKIINSTDSSISIYPTIPWIDTTVPVGTIVTPAIAAPYSGAVPIDVPISVPIDPPIDEPVDPPADTTLLGTVAAILAGITPISAILDNILASELDLADVIEVGITDVIDGIGDIAGTLTGGITSSLTDIQTKIDSLFDPPTDTINFDKIKNLNSVMFTKFPFSIPFDFIAMITAFNGDPVAPVLKIPFDLTSLGGENTELEFDLSRFDYIASIARQINFIGFAFFMLFNTRKFIWK